MEVPHHHIFIDCLNSTKIFNLGLLHIFHLNRTLHQIFNLNLNLYHIISHHLIYCFSGFEFLAWFLKKNFLKYQMKYLLNHPTLASYFLKYT